MKKDSLVAGGFAELIGTLYKNASVKINKLLSSSNNDFKNLAEFLLADDYIEGEEEE